MPSAPGSKKQVIGKWYVRNDFKPSAYAEVDFCERPKVVFTKLLREKGISQRVFILGGSLQKLKGISEKVFECVMTDGESKAQLVEKSPMPMPKTSFGVCFNQNQNLIYTVGGKNPQRVNSASCHVYSIEKDEWAELPALKEAVYSVSCTVFKEDKQLLALGGIDANDDLVRTIQRLNLERQGAEWEVLNVQLPTANSNMGLHLVSKDGLIVFGGWNQNAQSSVLMMMEKSNGQISFRKTRDKANDLKDADQFLQNGVSSEDPKAKETFFVGHDFIHVLDKSTYKFKTIRRINNQPTK